MGLLYRGPTVCAYSISMETAKGGPRTLDWAQGLAVGWTGLAYTLHRLNAAWKTLYEWCKPHKCRTNDSRCINGHKPATPQRFVMRSERTFLISAKRSSLDLSPSRLQILDWSPDTLKLWRMTSHTKACKTEHIQALVNQVNWDHTVFKSHLKKFLNSDWLDDWLLLTLLVCYPVFNFLIS